MDLLTVLRIMALVTNGAYCFIPRGDFRSSSMSASKPLSFPIQKQSIQADDISVYDPGVEKTKLDSPTMLISKLLPDANAVSHSNQLNANVNDNELNDEETRNFIDEPFTDSNNLDINHLMDNLREEIKYDENIAQKSALLLKLVEDASPMNPLPILYIEDEVDEPIEAIDDYMVNKRSGRYYRRYPWKRQNTRSRTRYESESRYLCVPSREDVFKLLIGLHENRNGNHQKTVHFCNRKRPAKAIFTNIRFLG